MKKLRLLFISLSVLLSAFYFYSCRNEINETEAVEAFAKSYGLIRWFYPSDEAQAIDWNKLALYGVEEVMKCKTEQELIETLNRLFSPLAPTAQFFTADKDITPFSWSSYDVDTTGLQPVCWQHFGVELDDSNFYVSKRFNRSYSGDGLAKLCLFRYMPGGEFAGCKAKLKMSVKTESSSGDFYAEPLLTSYAQNNIDDYISAVKKNDPQKLQPKEWTLVEKTAQIKDDPNNDIMWGIYADGDGALYVDNVELLIEKDGATRRIFFTGFEDGDEAMWRGYSLYDFEESADNPFAGQKSMRINTRNKIFDSLPDVNETVTQNIGGNIKLHFPLVLYNEKGGRTLPIADNVLFDECKKKVEWHNITTDTVKRLADIVVSWNIVNHFSPYLKDSKPDWEKELRLAIDRILYNKNDEAKYAMELMMAALNDAHYVRLPEKFYEKFRLPVNVQKVEGEVVVTDSFDQIFQKGDIIEGLNGESAVALYEKAEKLISGSARRKQRYAGLYYWGLFNSLAEVDVTYRREGETQNVKVKNIPMREYFQLFSEAASSPSGDSIKVFDNVLYLRLEGLDLEQVGKAIHAHKGKIPVIDMRYGGSRFLVRYILPFLGEDTFDNGLSSIPNVIRPNEVIPEEKKSDAYPREENPRFIVLMGPDNISNQEEFLDYVKCKNLGILIGTNSAGCSGRVNMTKLPSGEQWCYTGMRAYSRCGEDFYIKGVAPHYTVTPTIDDIKKGRDPVIEKALQVAQTMNK